MGHTGSESIRQKGGWVLHGVLFAVMVASVFCGVLWYMGAGNATPAKAPDDNTTVKHPTQDELWAATMLKALAGACISYARFGFEGEGQAPDDYRRVYSFERNGKPIRKIVEKLHNASARQANPEPWNNYLFDSIASPAGAKTYAEGGFALKSFPVGEKEQSFMTFVTDENRIVWGKMLRGGGRELSAYPADPEKDGWIRIGTL